MWWFQTVIPAHLGGQGTGLPCRWGCCGLQSEFPCQPGLTWDSAWNITRTAVRDVAQKERACSACVKPQVWFNLQSGSLTNFIVGEPTLQTRLFILDLSAYMYRARVSTPLTRNGYFISLPIHLKMVVGTMWTFPHNSLMSHKHLIWQQNETQVYWDCRLWFLFFNFYTASPGPFPDSFLFALFLRCSCCAVQAGLELTLEPSWPWNQGPSCLQSAEGAALPSGRFFHLSSNT